MANFKLSYICLPLMAIWIASLTGLYAFLIMLAVPLIYLTIPLWFINRRRSTEGNKRGV